MPDLAERAAVLRERLSRARNRAEGIREAAKPPLPPPPRRERRVRHRRPWKRKHDPRARPQARHRRLPTGHRASRARKRASAARRHQSAVHRRRSDAEVKRLLAAGAFASFIADSVRQALDDPDRTVIACTCGHLALCPEDDLAEKWADHAGKDNQVASVPAATSVLVRVPATASRFERHRLVRRIRRQRRAIAGGGLLARMRADWGERGWDHAGLHAFGLTAITAAAAGGNWTTGGTWVGAAAPTAADDAKLANTSGNVTIDSGAVCRSLDCTGYTGTLTHTAAVTLTIGDGTAGAGSVAFKLVSGMTYTLGSTTTSAISFVSTSGTVQTITYAAKVPGNLTFNGVGGSWQFQDAVVSTALTVLTVTAGTFDSGNQSFNAGNVNSSGTGVRRLILGSSSSTLRATSNAWNTGTVTNLTIDANTSQITLNGAGTNFLGGAGMNFQGMNLIFTGSGDVTISSSNQTFGSVTRTGTAAKTDSLTIVGNVTTTGNVTFTANSPTNALLIVTSVLGTQRTITCGGTVTITNRVDFRDISGAGTASWNLSGGTAGDALGNTGITFTPAVTRYGVVAGNWSSTATWSATSGGAGGASVPLPQDTVILDASSAAGSYTIDMPRAAKDLTCTGFTRTLNVSTTWSIFGSFTAGSGMTLTLSGQIGTLAGRSSHTITSATKTTASIVVAAVGGTYTLQDAFSTASNQFSVTDGTFAANGNTVSCEEFASTGTRTRAVSMGSGGWSLTRIGSATAIWNTTLTGLTLTPSTSTVSCTASPASATTYTVTSTTQVMPNWTVAGGTNLTVQFADGFTTAGTITLTSGKLDTNSQSVSASIFTTSNSNSRTLIMGTTTMTLSSTATAFTTSTTGGSTGLKLDVANSIIVLTGTTASGAFSKPSVTGTSDYGTARFTGPGTQTLVSSNTGVFANLERTGTAAKDDAWNLNLTAGATVTGALTMAGNSVTNRLVVQSNTLGTNRTLTANGTIVASNVDFADVTGAGSASWNLAAITGLSGDATGNSGITFTTPQTNYWVGNAGNFSDVTHWASTSGGVAGTGRVPLPQDTARFDANSFSVSNQNITEDMPRACKDVDFTGATNQPHFNRGGGISPIFYGSFNISNTNGTTTDGTWNFRGRGSHTITSGGSSSSGITWTFTAVTGTYTLQDAFSAVGQITMASGTFDTNSKSITTSLLTFSGAVAMTITTGTSVWSLTATTGTVWQTQSGATVNVSTATIVISTASTSSRTFTGGGRVFGTLRYVVADSPGPLLSSSATTFGTLDIGGARVIQLPAAVTTTATTVILPGQGYGYLRMFGVSGGHAWAPDAAAFDIVGDLEIVARVALDDWTPAVLSTIVAKFDSGSNRSYWFRVNTTGSLQILWSPDGTVGNSITVGSTVLPPFTDGVTYWVKVTIDVDNGVGGSTVRFLYAPDQPTEPAAGQFTQVGSDVVSAGTASIFAGAAALAVGSRAAGTGGANGSEFLRGNVYKAVVRSGIGGTVVASPDFTQWVSRPPGADTFVDAQGNTWTMPLSTGLATTGAVRLSSSIAGTPATLSVTSGTVTASHAAIKDSTATGGATFNADDSTNISGNTNWNFRLTGTATATSSSTGSAAPARLLQATGSGSSTSTGTSTPERIMPITASGQSTSDGTAAALRLLQASLAAESTSTGVLVALLDLQAAMAADAVSSGQVQMDRLLQAVMQGESFSESLLDAVRLQVMTARATAVSSGQLAAVLRLVVTASGASGTVGELTATRLLRATAAGSSTSVGVLVMLVARYLFGRIQLRPEVTARALRPEVTARTLHPEVDATVGIPAD